ncbi:MAG TPA: alginate lyase family protein, partial [Bryobacteraceae bacterium]|nr:alginate lyase family protein [Bryobacteraceae bacterium]
MSRNFFTPFCTRALEEAERLRRHEMELLNFPRVRLAESINWHRDPITGKVWERRFWTNYDLEHDPAGRDAKIVHELNRHQHLPRLAKAFHLTGDECYAAEAIAQIESWIGQNPAGRGVNWHSSLEIAIRAISWLWTIFLVSRSRAFTAETAQRIGGSLFAQLDHIYRHTSVHSSPNTHLLGEAAALFIAGTVFADLGPPAAWRELGAALLNDAAEKQILADGGYGELSSYYHCYALGFYLQALALDRSAFSSAVEARVCAMLEFLMHLARPDGSLPRLGDDDGGRDLALVDRDYRSAHDALCFGAVWFSRADFKYCARDFSEQTLWLLGEEALDRFQGLASRPPARTSVLFPECGYYVHRSNWDLDASHLILDCGGLGMLTGGHSHADSLSIALFANGQDLLIDPGTYLYNSAPQWRAHFRSSSAHNTVTVDERDQADSGGPFRWSTRFDARA